MTKEEIEKKNELAANLALLMLVASQAGPRKLTPAQAFTEADQFLNEAIKRELNLDRIRGL